jgi:hypothetical protein
MRLRDEVRYRVSGRGIPVLRQAAVYMLFVIFANRNL